MTRYFADLKPHELEMLALASEECCEVGEAVGKALRHGLNECHPDGGRDNIDNVARELGQVAAVVEMMLQLGVLDRIEVEAGIEEKWEKVGDYLHHVHVDAELRTAERTDLLLRRDRRRERASDLLRGRRLQKSRRSTKRSR